MAALDPLGDGPWQDVPVALPAFNRPHLVERLIGRLRLVRPRHMFLSIDGPRADRPGEAALVDSVAELAGTIDWPCELRVRKQPVNGGTCHGVVSAVDWMFESFEAGIVLEDDCLPEPSFFPFCAELLSRYADDERVGLVSAICPPGLSLQPEASYGFSRYCYIWGWATWKRAWTLMDPLVPDLEEVVAGRLLEAALNDGSAAHWIRLLRENHTDPPRVWSFQWCLTCWLQRMVCVVPRANLVSNVGGGADATNMNPYDTTLYRATEPMRFPLVHPKYMVVDVDSDARARREHFSRRSFARRVAGRIAREVRRLAGGPPGPPA